MSEVFKGIYRDMPSSQYHTIRDTYSSSQLKDLLEDPEIFYKKYILKTIERESISAFDVGTYFHTSILEPDKLKAECAVYGGIRRGKEWEAFKEANANKAIITQSELTQAEGIVEAVRNSPVAMNRISRGEAEISAFVPIVISKGEIFSEDGKSIVGKYGWEKTSIKIDKKNCVHLTIKVRADLLADTYILDLKSTTGNCKSEVSMRRKVSDYQYDLSASLYLDMFSIATGRTISEFLWTFASKDLFNSKTYIASEENVMIGRAKYRKALLVLASCISDKWQFEDAIGILKPNVWELEHIKPKSEDLL